MIPIDVCIQNILDNISKGTKVAGANDILNKSNLIEESESKNEKKTNGSIIDILRKNSNVNMSNELSFREKKPELFLTNQ